MPLGSFGDRLDLKQEKKQKNEIVSVCNVVYSMELYICEAAGLSKDLVKNRHFR
jgi:hypothetical protein